VNDSSQIFTAVTAVLIVACPCSLLLSATFTFGNMLRIFGKNKLYLKNATVIESLAATNEVVFDKTGTITKTGTSIITYQGIALNPEHQHIVSSIAMQSSHPLSQALVAHLGWQHQHVQGLVHSFTETEGQGIAAHVNNNIVSLGSAKFVGATTSQQPANASRVHVAFNQQYKGYFDINNAYREGIPELARALVSDGYPLHILSGDNDAERSNLQQMFGEQLSAHFNVSPQQKLTYISALQQAGKNVLMVGDGLNDAGALMQANTAIAVSEDTARFTPACDAIIDGGALQHLPAFISYAKAGKKMVLASFILSILYNIVGISFAVQAQLSPLVAAILMPASSISIVLFVTVLSTIVAKRKGLIC
jgi:Cu+-exporting ATPase